MTVTLASRISAVLMAVTIVAASWMPTLSAPRVANGNAPIVATS